MKEKNVVLKVHIALFSFSQVELFIFVLHSNYFLWAALNFMYQFTGCFHSISVNQGISYMSPESSILLYMHSFSLDIVCGICAKTNNSLLSHSFEEKNYLINSKQTGKRWVLKLVLPASVKLSDPPDFY